jgi:hypothetical protein
MPANQRTKKTTLIAGAALLCPAVAVLCWNSAQQSRNIREIHREVSSAIGVNLPRIDVFEHRELERQLAWRKRSWRDLFRAPPHVSFKDRYH